MATTMRPARSALAALVFATCGATFWLPAAHATRAVDMPAPTAEAVRRAVAAQTPAAAQASSAAASSASSMAERQRLREGVVDTLDADHSRVRIDGIWLRIVANQTRLIKLGRTADAGAIVVGQRLRFTLAGDAAAEAALGLVYVP